MGIVRLPYLLLTRLCLMWLACQIVGVNVYASGPPTPAEVGKVYGVHDANVNDSQFFIYDLNQDTFSPLGELHQGDDLEGLTVHPMTRILYASSGQPSSQLYVVDSQTGELTLVGAMGFDNVIALAFDAEGRLWGHADQGLIQIDVVTGQGVLVMPERRHVQSLTWDRQSNLLYAMEDNSPNPTTLWVYDGISWQTVCEGLPRKVEAAEFRPDGLLVYSFHHDRSLNIHTYDVSQCQAVSGATIATTYNDVEGIAWPSSAITSCGLSNQEALRMYLQGLEGVSTVSIAGTAVSALINGELHEGQLVEPVIAGIATGNSSLVLKPIADVNGDGINDFEITYPCGDQQILLYFGTKTQECRNLVAPAVDPTIVSIPSLVTEFLYTGANPIQTGVAAGAIDLTRAGVIRGKVTTRTGEPLPNVVVTIDDHAELGQTVTTCDGYFNIAVNGGSTLTVDYRKSGYLSAQRQVAVNWQQYAVADEVVMVTLDPQVTTIDLSRNEAQVAQGSVVTDEDGSRQATLVFPAGVQATVTLPDGSTQVLPTLNVRATEYTVGENGPESMPAPLPPASGYTYAVELSADEVTALGANRVDFSQPVPLYVDNFLNFPVGMKVPVGWYDYDKNAWIPSNDGRVVKILSIANGLAVLDVDGYGQAASSYTLTSLGITDVERQKLANLYSAGKSFWRAPITHFTPWDLNWPPFSLPQDSVAPPTLTPTTLPNIQNPRECSGCIIEAENQVLGESIPVAGTFFSLDYRSNRMSGYQSILQIPLRGDSMPASAKRIRLEVTIAGQTFSESFPVETKQTTFTWNGRDALGRKLEGKQEAKVRVGYEYNGIYNRPSSSAQQSFGQFGWGSSGVETRYPMMLWKDYTVTLAPGSGYPQASMGGFDLNAHHLYDPVRKVLYQGDGKQQTANDQLADNMIETVIGPEGVVTDLPSSIAQDIAVSPDGSLYVTAEHCSVFRVDLDGTVQTILKEGDIPSVACKINDIAFGLDGLYISVILYTSMEGYSTWLTWHSNIYRFDLIEGVLLPIDPPQTAFSRVYSEMTSGTDGNLYISGRFYNYVNLVDGDIVLTDPIGNSYLYGVVNRTNSFSYNDITSDVILGTDGYLYALIDRCYIGDCKESWVQRIGGNEQKLVYRLLDKSESIALDLKGNLYITDSKGVLRLNSKDVLSRVFYSFGGGFGCITVPCTNGWWDWDYNSNFATRIAGNENETVYEGFKGHKGPATAASLSSPKDIAFSPDGALYILDGSNRILRVTSSFAGFNLENIFIASEDGGLVYEFDPTGRHLRTLDTLTGQTVYTFTYNDNGHLIGVRDLDGDLTQIERNGNTPVAIVSPDGHRTTLSLNENGYLAAITNPAGESDQFSYTADGLLISHTNPRGNKTAYEYNEIGKLVKDTNPIGGGWNIARVENPERDGHTVTMTSGEGRQSVFQTTTLENGDQQRVTISPDGTRTESITETNGQTIVAQADGTVVVSQQAPDPRFGMQSPIAKNVTMQTPGGLTMTLATERWVEPLDSNNPFAFNQLIHKTTVNGRTSTTVYDKTTHTVTATSVAGRKSVSFLDSKGRVMKEQTPGLVDTTYTYDARGRLTQVSEGEGVDLRTASLEYDAQGNISQVTDALGRQVRFDYDAVGRITQQTLTDGRVISYRYDANGNVTAITPPGRPAHGFVYDVADQQAQYTPPAAGLTTAQTQYVYNLDKELTQVMRPDGQTIDFVYDDTKGRLNALNTPHGQYSYAYNDQSGNLTSVTAPDGNRLSYQYDGSLPLSVTWEGAIQGTLAVRYDNDFRVTATRINDSHVVNYDYDVDGLLIKAGELSLVRNPDNGLLQGTQLGGDNGILTQRSYNAFGETITETATVNGNSLYRNEYSYDKLGRITQKVETLEGVVTTSGYDYDVAGRLVKVTQNGVVTEEYQYDSNGNRLSAITATFGNVIGNYDEQDRLLQYAGNSYTYTANGERLTKTSNGATTQYHYDVLGNLRSVQLPDGRQLEYVIDASGRRVGKKINGLLTQGWLYQGSLTPIAELDGNGTVVTRFVYGSKANVPDYLVKGEQIYRILSDHLGSPRLVVDLSTGTVVQRLDYDTFGNVILDTNPGFQPFGFAGGLYDAETQLVRFGARDYDAESGRWTAKDPILFAGGDSNLYGYVMGDPVNFVDPVGLWGWVGAAIGATSGTFGGIVTGYANNGVKGALLGGVVGFLVGGTVGFVAPQASSLATAVVYGAIVGGVSNFMGQVAGNLTMGQNPLKNYSIGSTIGAIVAGGITGPFAGIAESVGFGLARQMFFEGSITGLYSAIFEIVGDSSDGGQVPFAWTTEGCH